MSAGFVCEQVADGVLLDSRLALYHEAQLWLAIADVHYAHEISLRAAGGLGPMWGMEDIRGRLSGLLADYDVDRLILCGDTVHNRAGRKAVLELLDWLAGLGPEVVLIGGNHDRKLFDAGQAVAIHETDGFAFCHGDLPVEAVAGKIRVEGHWHPSVTLRDGAGLRLRVPCFVQEKERWVLPAFSPWAGGMSWDDETSQATLWAISPARILKLPANVTSFPGVSEHGSCREGQPLR